MGYGLLEVRRKGMVSLTAFTAVSICLSAGASITAEAADNNMDYRRKVVGITGIMSNVTTGLTDSVTRGEFSQMLVKASEYQDYLPSASSVSVYSDVAAGSDYAPSIRIAAEQGWIVGYLGGMFRPDQPITLKEAVRGILGLLGYTNEDFTGNTVSARMSLFYSLELNDELDLQETEILTREDCVNLFYNLLKTENKSGQIYAAILGCEVNSDGEINPMELADNSLKGPKLIRKGGYLGDFVPFNVQEANIFINGDASRYETLKNCISSGYVVIYYNSTAKTVWAYTTDEDVETGRCAVRGTIENIYYSSADVMTPTAVTLDDGTEYKLTSSEMQFAFSVYGSLRVGDTVTLICEKTVDSNSDSVYTVIDYVED